MWVGRYIRDSEAWSVLANVPSIKHADRIGKDRTHTQLKHKMNTSDGARCFKVGYTKNGTCWGPFIHTLEYGRKSGGPSLPPENAFGIGGDAISRCLEGLTCTLQSVLSRSSITFSIPPQTHPPSLFRCKFGQITTPIFSKSG